MTPDGTEDENVHPTDESLEVRTIRLEPPAWMAATRWAAIAATVVLVAAALVVLGTMVVGPALG